MTYRLCPLWLSLYLTFLLSSCHSRENAASGNKLFELLPASQTGIDFVNRVSDVKDMNIFNYHNFYNGGGVAIGDVNNDGKPDIFFTSNQGENKLYINKGGWKFEEVSEKAGLKSNHRWHTGATMVDINGDGWLDIYVCNAGIVPGDDRANELYINQHDGTFKEEAKAYGLDDNGASTQAVFFDFDHDGDLDCFILNNSPRSIESFGYDRNLRNTRDPVNGDRLYRNDGGKFTDISAQAGIFGSEIGFGLGVAVGDVNNDGWEDIYVSNDFFERDYLYINQHDGTFKEVINQAMGHISNGSMGSDMADINNDGWLDIFTTEMLPESDYRLKTTIKFDNYDVQTARNQLDFHHQFTSNCLQLNNHDGTFSEIAQLAGVDATGWSWGALSFDFDNDGWKDLFVSNGISRDLTDQDFLEYFTNKEVMQKLIDQGFSYMDLIKKMPSVPISNYAFLNGKNLTFRSCADSLGLGTPSFSNGAAYADIDGDGDLDLVVNNENAPAFVYRNLSSEKKHAHWLTLELRGQAPNTFGIGARATLYSGGIRQVVEQMPSRGFQSSVEPRLHFGMGEAATADSLEIFWPRSGTQTLYHLRADTVLVLEEKNAHKDIQAADPAPSPWFRNAAASLLSGSSRHRENEYDDFDNESLIPKMLSTEGPKLAVGDLNGDGLEDFYVGSAYGDTAKIFIQQKDGRFVRLREPAFERDTYFENTGAAFFDADGDGDLDLVVGSGGNQAGPSSSYLMPRLYLNDGKGHFTAAIEGWPMVTLNASCVRILDFDQDGKPDIFIGARNIPGSYGLKPSSVLLRNLGGGHFADVTDSVAPDLKQLGMVTDARWADIDRDGNKELIIVGDWMPVCFFRFGEGRLRKIGEIPHSSGWWNSLEVADMNGDGAPDLVAGNFGLNSNIKADEQHPARLYVGDFASNGKSECIPVYYKTDGKAYPYYLKDEMEKQIPQLKKKFLKFSDYAGKSVEEIFSAQELQKASVLSVEQTQTCVFINDGKGHFTMEPLPLRAQFSPVFGVLAEDLDDDGMKDLFLAGNFYGLKPQTGRLDASYGTVLLGKKGGDFRWAEPLQTGLFLQGEARDIARIRSAGGGNYIIVAMNNAPLYIFQQNRKEKK